MKKNNNTKSESRLNLIAALIIFAGWMIFIWLAKDSLLMDFISGI